MHKTRIILTSLVILICLYESLTKGWFSFFLSPALLVVIPGLLVGQMFKVRSAKLVVATNILRIVQLIGALLVYVCTVGFGDTEDVLLFGFYITRMGLLADLSLIAAYAGAVIFVVSTLALIPLFVISIHEKLRQRNEARSLPKPD